MEHLKRFLVLTLVLLCAVGIVLHFGGCSKVLPLEPQLTQEEDAADFPSTLSKRGGGHHKDGGAFPQYAEHTFKFDRRKGYYKGGSLNTTNGSRFKIKKGDLTPPEGWTYGDPVTITMMIAKEDNKLVFTFGPSGCRFDPSAELTLSWKGLKAKKHEELTINLLDENDEPIEADKVDTRGQYFLMWIDHFSRYAISKGE